MSGLSCPQYQQSSPVCVIVFSRVAGVKSPRLLEALSDRYWIFIGVFEVDVDRHAIVVIEWCTGVFGYCAWRFGGADQLVWVRVCKLGPDDAEAGVCEGFEAQSAIASVGDWDG